MPLPACMSWAALDAVVVTPSPLASGKAGSLSGRAHSADRLLTVLAAVESAASTALIMASSELRAPAAGASALSSHADAISARARKRSLDMGRMQVERCA